MKKVLLNLLKVLFILAAVGVTVALVFGVVVLLGWPWWVGLFILLGMVGLCAGIVFVRKMLLKRKEQFFVQQVIDQDDTYIKSLGDEEKNRSRELQDRWKEAIQALRSSHLRKFGNPLYALPWYLIIGESGSGKTTAIKSAKLSSPFAELSRTSGISGTRNCDWWFFEQAIIIDTAGRYAIPVDEGRDKEEWKKFLIQLARFRKREPINGLIVTVAADKLLQPDFEILEQDGRSIRRRIDELMAVLGAKFPIYLLVTKADLIQGMTQFCDHLPEKGLDQAMGFINLDLSKEVMEFHHRGIHTISERLRDLRLLLFQRSGKSTEPELLLFPEEFERLKTGLDAFIKGAFKENPYQETPVLRGIFYSSGRQEGSPYSHFLKALGLIEERDLLPGTSKGLFLKDFFSKILPRDRGLYTPTRKSLEWSKITRNLGLTSWVAIVLALCGLLSFSFVKNLRTLKDAMTEFSPAPILQGEILTDVMTMDRFKNAVLKVEAQNRNWWIPRFWLYESMAVEQKLKSKYCSQFREGFLVSFDAQMTETMSTFSMGTPDAIIGNHAVHLVRRINLIKERLKGSDFEQLGKSPQPSFDTIALAADATILPEIRESFQGLYLYNLVWREDTNWLNQEMTTLQKWLKHVLAAKQNDLSWLVAWKNADPELEDVTLGEFWSRGDAAAVAVGVPAEALSKTGKPDDENAFQESVMVSRAFSVQGKEEIDAFIEELKSALSEPVMIAGKLVEFEKWYRNTYFEKWYRFGENFDKGMTFLKTREDWKAIAPLVAAAQGPYFALIARMAEELDPFYSVLPGSQEVPGWASLVFELQAIKDQVAKTSGISSIQIQDSSIVRRATQKVKTLKHKFQTQTGIQVGDGGKLAESRMVGAKAYENYIKALGELSSVAVSRNSAFQVTALVYREDPATGKSPFYGAQASSNNLRNAMSKPGTEQEMVWKLVNGPLNFLWDFANRETACQIRTLWEENVLVEVQGVSDLKSINDLLMGQDGYALKFIEGPVAPFLGRTLQKGYYAKEAMGKKIPFEQSFLSYLTKGAIVLKPKPRREEKPTQENFSVTIGGLPTDANPEAQIRPHATTLELKCADESFKIVNLNYPVRKTFNWSGEACGDVNFSIEVGNLVLSRRYSGQMAFPEFLKDFSSGTRVFTPRSFPEYENDLKRMDIRQIRVNYQFKGHEPLIGLLGRKTAAARIEVPALPKEIVSCWDR
jgi:type VI secretion system protein ImpL